jgi:hypothetical protein
MSMDLKWCCVEADCEKEFDSAGALGRHRSAVHGVISARARKRLRMAVDAAATAAAAAAAAAAAEGGGGADRGDDDDDDDYGGDYDGPGDDLHDGDNGPRAAPGDVGGGAGGAAAGGAAAAAGAAGGAPSPPRPDQPAAAPGLARMMLKPATARWAKVVHNNNISQGSAEDILAYLHRYGQLDIPTLPRQMRTVYKHVERYGAIALALASDRVGANENGQVHEGDWGQFKAVRYPYTTRTPVAGSGGRGGGGGGGRGRRTMVTTERVHEVYLRDLWSVIVESFLTDANVVRHLHFGYERQCNAKGDRVYSEMWTGNWWADAELTLPIAGCHLLAVILHMDDTPQGSRSVCPVYCTLGNLPTTLRRLERHMPVVAYIPKLMATKGEKAREAFRATKRELLHKFLDDLLAPVKAVQAQGGYKIDLPAPAPVGRTMVVPHIAIVVADNEEKKKLSLVFMANNGQRPCPTCLAPSAALADTVGTTAAPYPARRPEAMREAAANKDGAAGLVRHDALSETAARRAGRDTGLSLWLQRNALWLPQPAFNVYAALPPDLLHDADLGVYRRLVVELYAFLEATAASTADELDRRLDIMTAQPVPSLVKVFGGGGYRGLMRAEGAHFRALMQLLPLAVRGLQAVPAEVAALLADWPALYAMMRATAISAPDLDQWQVSMASWGARFFAWYTSDTVRAATGASGAGRSNPTQPPGSNGKDGGERARDDDALLLDDDDDDADDDGSDSGSGEGSSSDTDDDDDGGDGVLPGWAGGMASQAGVAAHARGRGGARRRRGASARNPKDPVGFIKLHLLAGGHVRDAWRRYGALIGYSAAPFEARHISAVKRPARRVAGSAPLVAELARHARRGQLLNAAWTAQDDGQPDGGPAARPPDDTGARLSFPFDHTTVAELERRLRVRDLVPLTQHYLDAEVPDESLGNDATAACPVRLMRRLHTAEGDWAYCTGTVTAGRKRPPQTRTDDVAVLGAPAGNESVAPWYGRLQALAVFELPSGRTIEAILVRWYERAPALGMDTAGAIAINATCPRLEHVFAMGWCSPASALRRVSIVPDWAALGPGTAGGVGDLRVHVGSIVFVNNFLRLVRPPREDDDDGGD